MNSLDRTAAARLSDRPTSGGAVVDDQRLVDSQLALTHFYHPELDTLRFVAFLMVFLHHALPLAKDVYQRAGLSIGAATIAARVVDAGRAGVDLFFVLSSYLITSILLRERALRGDFRIKSFYARRALRIWPLYFATIALCEFVLRFALPGENLPPRYVAAFALFSGNWAVLAWGVPLSAASVLWSVSIEEQFYIAWPLVLRHLRGTGVAVGGVTLILIAVVARQLIASFTKWDSWYNTFARLDTIGAGILLAHLFGHRTPVLSNAARAIMVLCAFLTIATVRVLHLSVPVEYPIVTLSCAVLIAATLYPSGKCPAVLRRPWLLYLGRISYGLYALHMIGVNILVVTTHTESAVMGAPRVLAMFAITLLLAATSYRFLESPLLRLKDRFAVVKRGA